MLNLIDDPWIPVLCRDGSQRIIAPWQITEADILYPDWPRPDLNIACLEFLIGLVFMADPPEDEDDWEDRQLPDPERLRSRLALYSEAFNLLGNGPRFLQDAENLSGEPNPVDMLFIDSSGAQTAKNNADLMVHRNRYEALDLPLAAMALYTFQAHAPSGGAGNRTSMRGGGPLLTLVDPQRTLWALVWANVPYGKASVIELLPWMRATRVSDKKNSETFPPDGQLYNIEAFFGMPRRIRLISEDHVVTGVVQRPYGTNYASWKHPLSPYYRLKPGTEWLPKHPRAGRFGYRNWLGVIVKETAGELSELALCLKNWGSRKAGGSVIIAGWSMDNMKPRDFILSRQRFLSGLSLEAEDQIVNMIKAAEWASSALQMALKPLLATGEARDAEREEFFLQTEDKLMFHIDALIRGEEPGPLWLKNLKDQALKQFNALALPILPECGIEVIGKIAKARKELIITFSGYGKLGGDIFNALNLPRPEKKKRLTA